MNWSRIVSHRLVWAVLATLAFACAGGRAIPAIAAEATTGIISGTVLAVDGSPVAGANVTAASASGRAGALTDARGRFLVLGLTPGSYTIAVQAPGFAALSQAGIIVLPGQRQQTAFRLVRAVVTIGTVQARSPAFSIGATSDSFAVTGQNARALTPPVLTSSGLANYAAGTVQGAIASVPGVRLDAFANAILRGGAIDDAVFDYDSVPIPQGLIAEPGGNVAGAQLPTTGIASTIVTLGGYQSQGENALGGVVDQIPAVGTYPGSATLELASGLAGTRKQLANLQVLGATPDQRWRYALASTFGTENFSYGDGRTFYPSEAATYGLALQSRGQFSLAANLHYRLGPRDDFAVLGLAGQANYDQYGTPYAGETFGAFDGATLRYPGATNPSAPVKLPTRIRGTYDIFKAQWLHTGLRSLSRVQLYQSRYGSSAGGPYWDENGFPNGTFSLVQEQGAREVGLGYDGELIGDRHHVRYGAGYRVNASDLNQVVPTFDQIVTSKPTLSSYLVYAGDTWNLARLDVMGAARLTGTRVVPQRGVRYGVAALDPHLAAVYRLGNALAVRATVDHTTVAPKPLEAERYDGSAAPFVRLSPETSNDLTFSLDGAGTVQFRATYYAKNEKNRIDVLPANFRQVVAGGSAPSPLGVPTNIGQLRAHGVELWLRHGGLTFQTDYIRASSSSATQFARTSLNAPAIAAGHLFPIGYVPDVTASVSYEFDLAHRRLRVTPALSFESGYPYGNGRLAWVFDPITNQPARVANDNFINPGANYYFLRDPAQPFNATTNPYIGDLGTPEGSDPNTLRTPPQTLVNLHIEGEISRRMTVIVDVANLFGNFSPTTRQGNPYLIGPPGYSGGNAAYAAAYQNAIGSAKPYVLGNGVPTNDGVNQSVPWTYGSAGYVPQSYPLGRTVELRLRYRL
ncbi:MAG: hypothetical protein NVS3B28_05450 [Candidatus Velthaea sp.]